MRTREVLSLDQPSELTRPSCAQSLASRVGVTNYTHELDIRHREHAVGLTAAVKRCWAFTKDPGLTKHNLVPFELFFLLLIHEREEASGV